MRPTSKTAPDNARRPTAKNNRLQQAGKWLRSHKMMVILAVPIVAIGVTIGAYNYGLYTQKFSDKDFAMLADKAETVLKNSGGKDIQTSKTCSYERPGEFDSLHLYCSVWHVTYMPYDTDQHAIDVARALERELRTEFKAEILRFNGFYSRPYNGSDTAVVGLTKPSPKGQCNFHIHTNRYALNAVTFLPPKTDNNLIALSFECSGESRAEYFPVTYRQG